MKVIFLDIDGVLNSVNTFKKRYEEHQKINKWTLEIDLKMLENLKEIVEKTDAKIVLSSSWRVFFRKEDDKIVGTIAKSFQLIELFKEFGLEIYDMTPFRYDRWREDEIKEWLEGKDVESYVVIDDDVKDLRSLSEKHIKTTFYGDESGLTDELKKLAIKKLIK